MATATILVGTVGKALCAALTTGATWRQCGDRPGCTLMRWSRHAKSPRPGRNHLLPAPTGLYPATTQGEKCAALISPDELCAGHFGHRPVGLT